MIKVRIHKLSDAKSYAKSVISKITDTSVSHDLAQKRLESCQTCIYFIPSTTQPDKHICNKCRCGERKILENAVYEYPYLECPLGMPGFSNEGLVKKE